MLINPQRPNIIGLICPPLYVQIKISVPTAPANATETLMILKPYFLIQTLAKLNKVASQELLYLLQHVLFIFLGF